MKLQVLIDLSLLFVLASGLKGEDWNITVPGLINATQGSDVIIPCTFAYPKKYYTNNVQVYWKTNETSNIAINDKNDKNALIYHPNDAFVLEEYRNRTKLIGDKSNGSCSMMILNIKHDLHDIYVRIIVNGTRYSFKTHRVSISVQVEERSPTFYVVTAVPASAALIIVIIVSGCLCYRKNRRSESLTREESGYYANFSRASSSPPKSEAECKTHDNTKYPVPKTIDEPVYANTEAITGQMAQRPDHKEIIYENVSNSQ